MGISVTGLIAYGILFFSSSIAGSSQYQEKSKSRLFIKETHH